MLTLVSALIGAGAIVFAGVKIAGSIGLLAASLASLGDVLAAGFGLYVEPHHEAGDEAYDEPEGAT